MASHKRRCQTNLSSRCLFLDPSSDKAGLTERLLHRFITVGGSFAEISSFTTFLTKAIFEKFHIYYEIQKHKSLKGI